MQRQTVKRDFRVIIELFNNIFIFKVCVAYSGGVIVNNELIGDLDRNGHVSYTRLLSLKYL